MELISIIKDKERLYLGADIPKEYTRNPYLGDAKTIRAVALPKTHEEVVELVKWANKEGIYIVVRGAGTGVTGAQFPIHGDELIIDLKLMNSILNLDEETMTLTVEPGVLVGDIHNYVEKEGFFYPPDPASKHSTIGGNVATNAGGLRAVKYGTTRDYIRALRVVLANGETLELGSLNIKDSSGYNLINLFIGSEGTLGIITEIKLKIIPKPRENINVLMSFEDVFKATEATISLLKSGVQPSEIELFEKQAAKYATDFLNTSLPTNEGNAYLLVELDGDIKDDLKSRLKILETNMKPYALEIIPLIEEQTKVNVKNIRDNILIGLMAYTQYEMLDEVVPINKFAELIQYTKELGKKHGISVLNFGHSGDGNVHTVLMKENLDDNTWNEKRKSLLDDLYQKVYELGGLPSAEHGIGIIKKEYLEKGIPKNQLTFMKQIKNVFDPDNRLNPGKVI